MTEATTYRLEATTPIALTANTAAQSVAFGVGNPDFQGQIVRIQSDVDGFCLFGTNPTATVSNGFPVKAGVYEYIDIKPGNKLSFISTSAGNLYVTIASKP